MVTWEYLLWIVLSTSTLFQVLVYGLFFSRLARYRSAPTPLTNGSPPVSVIICARNEEKNLQQYLPHFLNQKYHTYEVLVVDDGSTDGTWGCLLEFQKKYPNLSAVKVPQPTPPGKKAALAFGITQAPYDVFLLSDADCRPASEDWISLMVAHLGEQQDMVLGFSPYERTSGLLNTFIRFETVYTAIQYFSFAKAGQPYMGVGRNLMYTRSAFERTIGFTAHAHVASGDDDLFVNAAAHAKNTALALHPGTFTFSKPQSSWTSYYYQKSRHFSTGNSYRPTHQMMLGVLALSHSLHYAGLLLLAIAVPGACAAASLMYLARITVVAGTYRLLLKTFAAPDLWKWIPGLDALLPLYYLLFVPNIFWGNSTSWKQ